MLHNDDIEYIENSLFEYREMKYYEYVVATSILADSQWNNSSTIPVTTVSLFNPSQGTSNTTRKGNKCAIVRIEMRGNLFSGSTIISGGYPPAFQVRLILVRWKPCHGAIPNPSKIIDEGSNSAPYYGYINAFPRWNGEPNPNYEILESQIFDMKEFAFRNTAIGVVSQFVIKPIHWIIEPTEPILVEFNDGTSGTITDINTNSFHFMLNTSDGTIVCACNSRFRFYFKDVQ